MTAPSSIDPAHFLHEQLAQASPDLLRQMLTTFINTLRGPKRSIVAEACRHGRSKQSARSKSLRASALKARREIDAIGRRAIAGARIVDARRDEAGDAHVQERVVRNRVG